MELRTSLNYILNFFNFFNEILSFLYTCICNLTFFEEKFIPLDQIDKVLNFGSSKTIVNNSKLCYHLTSSALSIQGFMSK